MKEGASFFSLGGFRRRKRNAACSKPFLLLLSHRISHRMTTHNNDMSSTDQTFANPRVTDYSLQNSRSCLDKIIPNSISLVSSTAGSLLTKGPGRDAEEQEEKGNTGRRKRSGSKTT
jgi:hypothetical protein